MSLGVALLLFACDNDAELALRPAIASFTQETVSYSEDDGPKEIEIEFSKSVQEAGSLTVAVASESIEAFSFSPAPHQGVIELPVSKGATRVAFTVSAIDNDIIDGMKELGLTLHSASRGIQVGARNKLQTTWLDNESPSRVAFALDESSLSESATNGSIVTLTLSHAAPGDGEVVVSFLSGSARYGADFTTEPAAEGNAVVIPVIKGQTQVSMVVNPLNDALYNANRTLYFKIETVNPVLEKGTKISHALTIKDDELAGRPKSYVTGAGAGWTSRREIHYALDGRIEKVSWTQALPGATSGEYLYFYNDAGLIDKVITSPVSYIKYIRENGIIVKSEEYDNDELDKYTLFGYDAMGNIGEAAIYDRQSDGSFVFSLDFVYLYHHDGNLYKKMVYHPQPDGEFYLLSTDTYAGYAEGLNPFPIEIIHGQPIQTRLPHSFIHTTDDKTYEYSFSYEFQDGLPSRRTISGHGTNESTTYEYY